MTEILDVKSQLQNSFTQQNRPFEANAVPSPQPTHEGLVSSNEPRQLCCHSPLVSKSSIFPGKEVLQLPLKLPETTSIAEKIERLDEREEVRTAYKKMRPFIRQPSLEAECAFKQWVAIGQFFFHPDIEAFNRFLDTLIQIDAFYAELGGIMGYQKCVLDLLKWEKEEATVCYHPPSYIDISKTTPEVSQALLRGLEALEQMALMVPLGGAADRLHLVDEKTGNELPAAKLSFAGRPLLASLIRDLQAAEYLYYKLFGKQITTPLALMTSEEKDNHRHVQQLMEENGWFGRPKESIRFFKQPLVPVVTEEGNWCWVGPYQPLMKPGGHGAIWKLARDQGIFTWLSQQGRSKALIRQINNPIAGLDYGLLAFYGLGVRGDFLFGFASCPRLLNAAEGVNVLLEKKMEKKIVLTNVEYCDFAKQGLEPLLQQEGFSSNTNILFADLAALEKAVQKCPYPGLLINLKRVHYTTHLGEKKEAKVARLESTMQNIADVFEEERGHSLMTERTFVTFNHRHKTISTAKKAYVAGQSLQETPEKCFYDLLMANREALAGWDLPSSRSLEEYLQMGPELVFLYHPALGPIYDIIRQKIGQGKIALGSELQLEIADLRCNKLHVDGSLQIRAQNIVGETAHDRLRYSEKTGRCILRDVSVWNRGVDWARSAPFWKNRFCRHETLLIELRGHSEFVAEHVRFTGAHHFIVDEGVRMAVSMEEGELIVRKEALKSKSFWTYQKDTQIILK